MSEKPRVYAANTSGGAPRGSAKAQDGEATAHPGRGGENAFIGDKPSPSHARGSGAFSANQSPEPGQTDAFVMKGNFKGHGNSSASGGEPVAHPGRGGMNYYIDDKPSPNHPRGSGEMPGGVTSQSTPEPQSANDPGFDALKFVADRVNEVAQNQSLLNQSSAEV